MSWTVISTHRRISPHREIPLELAGGTAYFMKMEVHTGIYWYST